MPSHLSSAGIARIAAGYGSTSRKDVLGRVHVPVMPGAAGGTPPRPHRKAKRGSLVPALIADLAGRVPAVDRHQAPSSTRTLVLELTTELTPGSIRDRTGHAPVPYHPGDVQILDDDQVVVGDQAAAGLVQEVGPRVTDFAMDLGNLGLSLLVILRATLGTRHAALITLELDKLLFQVTRVGDVSTIGSGGEVGQAQVDSDLASGPGLGLRVAGLHGEHHIPTTVRFPGHDHRRRVQRRDVHLVERPHEEKRRSGLGQAQHAVAQTKGGPSVVSRLPTATRFETGVACTFGEEGGERGMLVPECLLQRYRGHLRKERQLVGPLPPGECPVRGGIRRPLPALAPGSRTVGERLVPHQAHTPERAGQDRSLLGIRVRPTLERRPHNLELTRRD